MSYNINNCEVRRWLGRTVLGEKSYIRTGLKLVFGWISGRNANFIEYFEGIYCITTNYLIRIAKFLAKIADING
jgi:hypothetical protein